MVIGLSGRICSGKSYVASCIREKFKIEYIDVDSIGHLILKERENDIIDLFKSYDIKNKEGHVDRKKLSNLVFSKKDLLKKLENYTHPKIKEKIEDILKENQGKNFLLDAALLQKIGLLTLCDALIFLDINRIIRYKRFRDRNKLGLMKFLKIEFSQLHIKNPKNYIKPKLVCHNTSNICRQVINFCSTLLKIEEL